MSTIPTDILENLQGGTKQNSDQTNAGEFSTNLPKTQETEEGKEGTASPELSISGLSLEK